MPDEILKINNLSFSYNGTKVINNISFAAEKGSFVSVLGPNGSGKSTLINLISNALKGYEGSISVFGRDIKRMNSKEIAKLVAVVPQSSNPGFDFNVEELVLMGRFPYVSRFGSEKIHDFIITEKIMKKTGVLSLAKKKFNELSGGEKQRVIIAQALVQDSPLLLLDEPTSHLDINFQIELMDLFYSLNRNEDKTIIGVFHDLNLAANYSRTALLLKQGRIHCIGEVEKIITRDNIQEVFHSDVFVAKNPVTQKVYISPAFGIIKENNLPVPEGSGNIRVHVIGGGGAASPLLDMLTRMGYKVTCGVINNFDSDLDTASMLGITYVSEAPFSPISFYSQNKNMELIRASDIVILPPVAFGNGNFSNLVSVKEALEMKKKVIIVNSSGIAKRDYTGGKAAKIYEKLLEKGAIVVDSISRVPEKI
jgi:iron complex transport system ATP-binding protein